MTRKSSAPRPHRAFRALLLAGTAVRRGGRLRDCRAARSRTPTTTDPASTSSRRRPARRRLHRRPGTARIRSGRPRPPPSPAAAAAAPRRNELGGSIPDLPRGAAAPTSADTPPLLGNLGALSWPAGTANPEAQAYFDQGYRLAWGFNHAEAARAFRAAQLLDPDCAMCLWGEAWVLGPHINFIMEEDANRRAVAALERARRAGAQGRRDRGRR